jgi:hypothetical protein
MRSLLPTFLQLSIFLTLLALLATPAFASNSHDRTEFGHDISVGPGEEVSEVTCFGCSIRIRGKVDGDATTFGGSVILEDQGEVGGDATTFAGSLRLRGEAKVGGDVAVFAGRIQRDPDTAIGGDVTNFSGPWWLILIFGLPLAIFGAFVAFVVWIIRLLTRPATTVAA